MFSMQASCMGRGHYNIMCKILNTMPLSYVHAADCWCANGGTCVSPNGCNCAANWEGPHCFKGINAACMHVYTLYINVLFRNI